MLAKGVDNHGRILIISVYPKKGKVIVDSQRREISIVKNGRTESESMALIGEEPLSIRIQGAPYAVIMRTPGAEKAHVAGFCLGEGIVERSHRNPKYVTTSDIDWLPENTCGPALKPSPWLSAGD
jgi:formate dehydrogenase assembly factor FdhD